MVLGSIPGVPINTYDLSETSLALTGMVSWIIGLNILLVGLGMWRKNKLAKWIAVVIFALSGYFNFIQILLLGLVGAPLSIAGLITNSLILYLLWKADFRQIKRGPVGVIIPLQTPAIRNGKSEIPETQREVVLREGAVAIPEREDATSGEAEAQESSIIVRNETAVVTREEAEIPLSEKEGGAKTVAEPAEIRIIVGDTVVVEKNLNDATEVSNGPGKNAISHRSNGSPVVIVEIRVQHRQDTPVEVDKKEDKH
jgi:hypothetical protein